MDEFIIIEEAKKNSDKFRPLYEKHFESIYRFIYRRINDKEITSDITSEVFLKAMISLSTYDFNKGPFLSWLYCIARNLLIDEFRKNKIRRVINIRTEKLIDVIEEIKIDHLEAFLEKLPSIIAKLDEQDLFLVEMRFFEQRPFKEIAAIVGSSEPAVKMKLYRVLEKIKKNLL